MRIGFVTTSVSRLGGGIFNATRLLARSLHRPPDRHVTIFGLTDAATESDRPAWGALPVTVAPIRGARRFGFSRELDIAVAGSDLDLLHTHGLWAYPSVASRRWSDGTGRPYMISPHGMLDPWALRRSRLKKKIASLLYERAHLKGAASLHALCEPEMRQIRALGFKNPICIVANGVELPDATGEGPCPTDRSSRPFLLFLGRVHPKKGLRELLQAWQLARRQGSHRLLDWDLVIAGWDENDFTAELQELAAALGVADSVRFPGAVFGDAKQALFRAAAAFVLPSFSEGQPMAILEAWSHALPVLMTPACNLPEGFAADAALSTAPEPEALARAIEEMVLLDEAGRRRMGAHGRALVARCFAPDAVTAQMAAAYAWLLGGGARPDCVHVH